MDDEVYAGELQASPMVTRALDEELARFIASLVDWLNTRLSWINARLEHRLPALPRYLSHFSVHSAGGGEQRAQAGAP